MKLSQYCGIVRLRTCLVEILPKVGMDDLRTPDELGRARSALLAMLHRARGITMTHLASAPQQAVRAPLLDVFIESFLHSALAVARQGLLSRYVEHVDDVSVARGRLHTNEHIKHNFYRPHVLRCAYDEFTADNAYNRAIRAALDACRGWISSAPIQRLWFEALALFSSVTPARMSAAAVKRLRSDRITRRYEPVLHWCAWLLAMLSPALASGVHHAPALLFDMNKLFEAHVSALEAMAAPHSRILIRQGPMEPLARVGNRDAFTLRPDITVWHANANGEVTGIDRVLDVKWKRLNPLEGNWGVSESDIYQLLAYAVHYQCTQFELVYPASASIDLTEQTPPVFVISSSGFIRSSITIRVRTVPLWG
ncbi:McrC family protein [Ralstonia syzygii]|uniref:McrC family protein n=1 Tax=Ralstonia syzygii TaxID=28097 RepID=UPI0018D0F81E|nr:restriction endonuclease [Ralstonia syzygii]